MAKSGARWALFVVLLVAAAIAALIFVVAIATVLAASADRDTGDTIIGAIFFLVVAAVLSYAARRVEHRARTASRPLPPPSPVPPPPPDGATAASVPQAPSRGSYSSSYEGPVRDIGSLPAAPPHPSDGADEIPPVARPTRSRYRSDSAAATLDDLQRRASRRRWRRHRRETPHSDLAATVVLGVVAVLMAVTSVGAFVDGARSDRVQHHGIAVTGTVERVVKVRHYARSGDYTTVNLDLLLAQPVKGTQRYTVSTPYSSSPAGLGGSVSILVDPNGGGYAELRGAPNSTDIGGWVAAAFAAAFFAYAVFIGFRYRSLKAKQSAGNLAG